MLNPMMAALNSQRITNPQNQTNPMQSPANPMMGSGSFANPMMAVAELQKQFMGKDPRDIIQEGLAQGRFSQDQVNWAMQMAGMK